MDEIKYESYEEALQRETIKNLKMQNQELEQRTKLESSLNTLAVFAILGIMASILIVGFFVVNIMLQEG